MNSFLRLSNTCLLYTSQSADDVATMIEDIATIIYHPEDADQLHYFYKLPAE